MNAFSILQFLPFPPFPFQVPRQNKAKQLAAQVKHGHFFPCFARAVFPQFYEPAATFFALRWGGECSLGNDGVGSRNRMRVFFSRIYRHSTACRKCLYFSSAAFFSQSKRPSCCFAHKKLRGGRLNKIKNSLRSMQERLLLFSKREKSPFPAFYTSVFLLDSFRYTLRKRNASNDYASFENYVV